MVSTHSVASTLKKLRKESGLNVEQVVEQLNNYGIRIAPKTLYGYESGISSTNADMFIALCQIYGCYDVLKEFLNTEDNNVITNEELKLIEKYRFLTTRGKEIIGYVLEREYEIADILKNHISNYEESATLSTSEVEHFSSDTYDKIPDNGEALLKKYPLIEKKKYVG